MIWASAAQAIAAIMATDFPDSCPSPFFSETASPHPPLQKPPRLHLRSFRPGRGWGLYRRFHHLGGNDHRLADPPTGRNNLFLDNRDLLRRHFHPRSPRATITPSAARIISLISARAAGFFNLGQDRSLSAQQRSGLQNITGALNKDSAIHPLASAKARSALSLSVRAGVLIDKSGRLTPLLLVSWPASSISATKRYPVARLITRARKRPSSIRMRAPGCNASITSGCGKEH